MEEDVSYSLENAEQFWDELDDIVSAPHDTHELIDDILRAFIDYTTKYTHLHSEYDIARCCYKLLDSHLFATNHDYVRRQFVYGLLQEDEPSVLHIVAAFLLFDGRSDEATFQMMQDEGTFPRLMDLIKSGTEDDTGLHRLLLELLCAMSRIQQLSWDNLNTVDDAFILYLFQLIEELSNDASDPYHYPIIRILLVLNEQYMCFANPRPALDHSKESTPPLTNRIIKILSAHGPAYRTFGENLILLLNRESELGPQLLILKLLYLLFTTPSTYEYFYTNDLHVLVDVIIRNLLDFDSGSDDDSSSEPVREGGGQRALRHTYLRVLCPLLRNTQLAMENNHYKREELRKLCHLLVHSSSMHFAPVDATIVRLVSRCRQVEWLRDEEEQHKADSANNAVGSPPTEADIAKKLLGMNLAEAGESSLSILDVAAKVEKQRPMLPAPRRRKKKLTLDSQDGQMSGSQKGEETPMIVVSPIADDPLASSFEQLGGRSPFADDYNE